MDENISINNIMIFSGIIVAVSIISYILLKIKNLFRVSLALTFVTMLGLSLFVSKYETPLQYTDMDSVGVWYGFAMMILYALTVGMLSINMVGLCFDHDEEFGIDNNFMSSLPFVAIIESVLLTLHKYDVISFDWCLWFLGAASVGGIIWIIFGKLDFDFNKTSVISLPGIVSIFIMYCYIVPVFCEHAAVAVIGGALFSRLLFKYEFGFIGDSGSSHQESTSYASMLDKQQNLDCQPTTTAKSKNTITVTIMGVYQLNGPKPFKRVIECDKSEIGYYTQLMGNKAQKSQWIQANFPGANTEKDFPMKVNIK